MPIYNSNITSFIQLDTAAIAGNSQWNWILLFDCIKEFSEGGKDIQSHQQQLMSRGLPKRQRLQGVEHVVLVASGKGGVGKSTTAGEQRHSLVFRCT